MTDRPGIRYYDFGFLSFRLKRRTLILVIIAAFILAGLAFWTLTLGSYAVPLGEIMDVLGSRGDSGARFVVMQLRLPRILSAVLVGAALAMAGALLQGVVSNPLASPDIIGINAGASAAAVFWVISGFDRSGVPPAAFIGALCAAGAIYTLSRRGHLSTSRLVLVGIGVNAMLTALIQLLMVRGRIDDVQQVYRWMAGSFYTSMWPDIHLMLIAVILLAPVGAAALGTLRVMQIGESTARSVGIPVEAVRLGVLGLSCALSALAVSISGPIGFAALAMPHLARMLAGPMSAGVFVLCGLLGSILLLAADIFGQYALPVMLPAGVVTAAVGAPYFLVLLCRSGARIEGRNR